MMKSVLASLLFFSACSTTFAGELLIGIDDSRSRISSGAFRVSGTTVEMFSGKKNREINEDMYMSFDFERGCIRAESGEAGFLLTPENAFQRFPAIPGDTETTVKQHDVTFLPAARHVNPFDVRNLGFFTCRSRYFRFTYDDFRVFMLNEAKVIETNEDNVLTEVQFAHAELKESNADNYPVFRVWLDKERSYTTTRIDVGDYQTSEISWEEMNGVYVPVSFRQRYDSKSSGMKINADWALTWESVNEPIPQELFTYESLKREGDTHGVLYASNVDETRKPVALDHFGSEIERNQNGRRLNVTMFFLLGGFVMIVVGAVRIAVQRD